MWEFIVYKSMIIRWVGFVRAVFFLFPGINEFLKYIQNNVYVSNVLVC